MKKILNNIITNLTVILSVCFIALWIFDYYNPLMNLMNNAITGKFLLILFVCGLYLALEKIWNRLGEDNIEIIKKNRFTGRMPNRNRIKIELILINILVLVLICLYLLYD